MDSDFGIYSVFFILGNGLKEEEKIKPGKEEVIGVVSHFRRIAEDYLRAQNVRLFT